MLNRQSAMSLPKSEREIPRVLGIWFFPTQSSLKPITRKEKEWSLQLSTNRSRQYHHSRGCVREALSQVWRMPALKIPLFSPPSKAPELPNGWGNISFSHCCDGLLVGWSPNRIGVDIERADRLFNAEKITNRYFSKQENNTLNNLNQEDLRSAVLEKWVIKEAAIKWQRGSILKDFSKWNLYTNSKQAIHQSQGSVL